MDPFPTCRLLLAALHYNENANRQQAETTAGQRQFKISFPKYKAGGYTVCQVLVSPTYSESDVTTTEIHTCAKIANHSI